MFLFVHDLIYTIIHFSFHLVNRVLTFALLIVGCLKHNLVI